MTPIQLAVLQQNQEEEENMTHLTKDSEGWEFKIVRSNQIQAFAKQERMQQMLAEESQSGWQLVEKLDDNRVRLKREVSQRSSDPARTIDPYRTTYGKPLTIGIGGVLLFLVVFGLIFFLFALIDS